MDTLSVFFLAQGEQSAASVMARLTAFIRAATRTLDFAVYDMRFSEALKTALVSALRERAEAGVQVLTAGPHEDALRRACGRLEGWKGFPPPVTRDAHWPSASP